MRPCRSLRAAELYLAAGGNGPQGGLTLQECADQVGVRVSSVWPYVARLRAEHRPERCHPEDECTL